MAAGLNFADLLMIDTAGRLQNRQDLMEELAKIVRVIRKRDPELNSAPSVPDGVTADQGVISQLVGRHAYAPGVYVDRRTNPERRQTVWRARTMSPRKAVSPEG